MCYAIIVVIHTQGGNFTQRRCYTRHFCILASTCLVYFLALQKLIKMAIKSRNLENENLERFLEVRYIDEDIGKCLCII